MAKRRTVQVSIIIVMALMAAVFVYILATDLKNGEMDINITLPVGNENDMLGGDEISSPVLNENLKARRVEVTRENVQDVIILTMERPTSYHITLASINYYGNTSSVSKADYWVNGSNSRIRRSTDGKTAINEIYWNNEVFMWSESDTQYQTYPAGEFSSDASAEMMTYEAIGELDASNITQAQYASYGEQPSIYVKSYDEELNYTSEYYISLDTGLLLSGTVKKDTTPIYSMTLNSVSTGAFDENVFTLPTGQTLVE